MREIVKTQLLVFNFSDLLIKPLMKSDNRLQYHKLQSFRPSVTNKLRSCSNKNYYNDLSYIAFSPALI